VIKEIGIKYGYNIVLHGSMNRDLDLIAIPWSEYILDYNIMLDEICECIGGNLLVEDEENFEKFRKKYHGRTSYIININRYIKQKYNGMVTEFINSGDTQYYIDISIIPTIKQ
jgi:hypothetical protein